MATHFSESSNRIDQLLIFVAFVGCFVAAKALLRAVGYLVDWKKTGGASYYFLGDLIALLNYYTFYRTLFSTVESGWTFAAVQALHVAHEWLAYPLRSTQAYWSLTVALLPAREQRREGGCLPPWIASVVRIISQSDISVVEWRRLIALDCECCAELPPPFATCCTDAPRTRHSAPDGVRVCAMIITMTSFVAGWSFLYFGYNRAVFKMVAGMSPGQYRRLMLYCGVSAATEVVNAAAMDFLYFRRYNVSILARLHALLAHPQFRLLTITVVAAVTCNSYIAEVRLSFPSAAA